MANKNTCITHSHACDCREELFKETQKAVSVLSQALQDVQTPPYADKSLALDWVRGRAITALAAIPKEVI